MANKSFECEFCGENVNTRDNEEDYLTTDVNNCEMWCHKDCLEKAKKLIKCEWTQDY